MHRVPEGQAFAWKTQNKELKIQTLQELYGILIDTNDEDISYVMKHNVNDGQKRLRLWLQQHFSDHIELIKSIEIIEELPHRELRERLIEKIQEEIYMK